jgi:hypothetical protein
VCPASTASPPSSTLSRRPAERTSASRGETERTSESAVATAASTVAAATALAAGGEGVAVAAYSGRPAVSWLGSTSAHPARSTTSRTDGATSGARIIRTPLRR